MIFRNDELRDFLCTIKEKYQVTPLAEWDGGPGIILRHDLDLDITPAYRLFKLERECGVRSSYFVQMTSPFYNTLADFNQKMLREMAEAGYEIGLHFEPTMYRDSGEKLVVHVQREAAMLEQVTGQPVRSVSLHDPSVEDEYPLFDGFLNAYDPKIFAPDRYLADSRLRFHHDPWEFIKQAEHRVIQLLLHPLHYTDDGQGYEEIMSRYLIETAERLDGYFKRNSTYVETVTPDILHALQTRIPAMSADDGNL